ncbi:type I 3-dehydroquinate dehydratase [Geomicrobium sp. JCM 19039]|uniref:type I 3-dehydroquinate dehydratase n=1 Tax=Geomicrobium sp. JCM 19039 TaxID=1460636 RepID=UPI00045F49AD|nr:type I 3-dehydroquinate dehydratase [Geomicrobium sp. JCM 19039]GAK12071.1 3-dehydroquinate dehydratase I [Geomicrobium sp. JCM 19039]
MKKQVLLQDFRNSDQQRPLICTPLTGVDRNALMTQLEVIVKKNPDIIEWRVDFFAKLDDVEALRSTAEEIRNRSAHIPILFTRRSMREGGESITMTEDEVFDMYEAIIKSGTIDLIDVELSSEQQHIDRVKALAQEQGVQLLMSYHNFAETPSEHLIYEKLQQADEQGADVGKVAVMPQSVADVLTLLQATNKASEHLSIPVVTMSMGRLGALSRMMGGACGSAMTFAVGSESSAPGQMPIEQLETVLEVIDDVMGE